MNNIILLHMNLVFQWKEPFINGHNVVICNHFPVDIRDAQYFPS
jgi:hypothetical protein